MSFALLPAALWLPAAGVRAESFCTGEEPRAVLDCLSRAWDARDLDALEGLYAPDYTFVLDLGDRQQTFDRASEIQSASRLFRDPKVQTIRLVVDGNPEVSAGDDPDTWIIRGVDSHLSLQAAWEGRSEEFNVEGRQHELRVRRVAVPEPHWQIYRWLEPRTE